MTATIGLVLISGARADPTGASCTAFEEWYRWQSPDGNRAYVVESRKCSYLLDGSNGQVYCNYYQTHEATKDGDQWEHAYQDSEAVCLVDLEETQPQNADP
ncbi:MAG: hypothetical protein HY556_03200 [Euryarchaeota archaeon]|nr:hypothetical protein [Euryarchaeota archaeon]